MILHEAVVFAVLKIIASVRITLWGAHGRAGVLALADAGRVCGLAFCLIATGVIPHDVGATRRFMRWREWGRWRQPFWARQFLRR